MVKVFDTVDGAGKPATKQIANFTDWTYFYIQVFGPGTVRLACTERELISPEPAGAGPLHGLQVTAAMGILPFRWKGALWGIGSVAGVVADMQFPGGQP